MFFWDEDASWDLFQERRGILIAGRVDDCNKL